MSVLSVQDLKARFTVPYLWHVLGLPGNPGKRCRSPFREDSNPSFSVYGDGTRFNDFAEGYHGDVVDFVALSKGFSKGESIAFLRELAGGASVPVIETPKVAAVQPEEPEGLLPYSMSKEESRQCLTACELLAGYEDNVQRVAQWRGWSPETIRNLALDLNLGILGDSVALVYESGLKLRWSTIEGDNGFGDKETRAIRWAFGKQFIWRALPLFTRGLRAQIESVVVTEGETDCVTLVDQGFEHPSLSQVCVAIGGATGFKSAWGELFRGLNVIVGADSDEAGQKAMDTWARIVAPYAACVMQLRGAEASA
jgi:hypothetical protein